MSTTPPPVAFSLAEPLAHAASRTRRRPVSSLLPVLVLWLPLVPLMAGLEVVLRGGGSAALQGLIAGAPAGRPGALIIRPDLGGWLLLAALAALLVAMLAVILAAGLVTGAAASRRAGGASRDREPGVGASVQDALAIWPAMLVVIVVQLLAVAVLAGVVTVAALGADEIQFQLPTVVLTLGLGALLILAVRCSLWPAVALAEGLAPLAALRRSLAVTRGSVTRLLGAALAAFLAVIVPALVIHAAVKAVLTQLAGQEIILLSPLAIDLWALLPFPIAVLLLSALWGREAPLLHRALVAFPGDESAAGD